MGVMCAAGGERTFFHCKGILCKKKCCEGFTGVCALGYKMRGKGMGGVGSKNSWNSWAVLERALMAGGMMRMAQKRGQGFSTNPVSCHLLPSAGSGCQGHKGGRQQSAFHHDRQTPTCLMGTGTTLCDLASISHLAFQV